MAAKGHYIMIDESILRDVKIEDLIISLGYEAFGFYIALLTLVRGYDSTGYRIPYERLNLIERRHLNLSDEEMVRFSEFLEKAIDLELLRESEDGKFFWSERRRIDLLKQEEARKKMSEAGIKGMASRYKNNTL